RHGGTCRWSSISCGNLLQPSLISLAEVSKLGNSHVERKSKSFVHLRRKRVVSVVRAWVPCHGTQTVLNNPIKVAAPKGWPPIDPGQSARYSPDRSVPSARPGPFFR